MIIILNILPSCNPIRPIQIWCPQDHQNNLNRKIGKQENRKIGKSVVLSDLCENSFRNVWKCREFFVTLQGIRKHINIWIIKVSKSPSTPVPCCSL